MFKNIQCLVVCLNDVSASEPLLKYMSIEENLNVQDLLEKPLYLKWLVTNKYFYADVQTCFCSGGQIKLGQKEDFDKLECIIILFTTEDAGCLQKINDINSLVKKTNPEICLLYDTNESSDSDDNRRDKVFEWSVQNNFELVQNNQDENENDGFEEKFGIDRVTEALNSHVWSSHIRNDGKLSQDDWLDSKNISDSIKHSAEEASDCFKNGASFEEMFSKFQEMKEKAKNLEGVARKEYAEKVTLAFMEVLGIDDNDDDSK